MRGSRLILRKERPHPGAQLTFTDVEGMRITAFLTDTPPGVVPGQLAGLELRHRQHARVEDRIRQAKATGLRNRPCRGWEENNAWLEVVLMATDLITWTKLLAFADHPVLAKCEIAAFRYRVLHVAARVTPAPARCGCASTRPGPGPPRSPPAGADYAPPSADQPTHRPDDPGPRNPPPPARQPGLTAAPTPQHGPEPTGSRSSLLSR